MVFTAGQFYLSEALSGRDQALKQLQAQVSELSDLLSSTQQANTALQASATQLNAQLATMKIERDTLTTRVAELAAKADQEKARADAATGKLADLNTTVSADAAKVDTQLKELESLRRDIAALQQVRTQLEARVAWLAAGQKQVKATEGALRDRGKELEAKLADTQDRTVLAQTDIANPETKLRDLSDRAITAEAELRAERAASAVSRAEIGNLTAQVAALRDQLARIAAALDISESKVKEQQGQIVELGKRLNLALVNKVEELAQYRSEFFGKVRQIIGNRPDIRIVGDRFVFQSEVLFPQGSADLQDSAKKQLDPIFDALKTIAAKMPPDLNWVLRVDGHTDHRKISTPEFPSNWELSTARAISVVRYAVEKGIPANRLAAAGFADNQPIDPGNTEDAYRRNRRIELKLTER
ncbi:MAG TPA: peptidoglycan -binding protein [Stellaceae bacterium]|nr:peptidoglycan -binding protein [Stellaceae bacterium]